MNALSPRGFELAAEETFAAMQRSLDENASREAISLKISRFLSSEEQSKIRNRISRAQGQLAGIIRMLDGRVPLPEIVIQMRAASKAVRRTAVRLLIVGYGVQSSPSGNETMLTALSHGFQMLSSMTAGEPGSTEDAIPRLISGQQALNKAQMLLEQDGSYLEMIAALAVAGRTINETSFSLLLEKLADAHAKGSRMDQEIYEKLLMAYA